MLKRKFKNEDDVFVDDAPVPSPSNNRKYSRKISDVIDNDHYYSERVESSSSTPVEKKSTHSNSVLLDQEHEDKPGNKAGMVSERLFKRSDTVDATPPVIPYEEYEEYEGTPGGIEAIIPVAKDAECYNMSHANRGTCLVFNHEIFEEGISNRDGSNIDVQRIESTFSKLGFDVVVHNDLEYCDVMEKIRLLSKPENHIDSDCVCVFVLTHGQSNDYLSAKDAAYSSDKIWKPFIADNCPTLAGKPKLFFIQACRGKKLDGGVRMMRRSDDHNICEQTDSAEASYTIPTLSDFLIAHSCPEGFYSWRNPEEGTWYVQSLCNVLDEFSESTDLLKMLTMTARKVATEFQSYDNKNPQMNAQKQIPSVTSTLTRDLYFSVKK